MGYGFEELTCLDCEGCMLGAGHMVIWRVWEIEAIGNVQFDYKYLDASRKEQNYRISELDKRFAAFRFYKTMSWTTRRFWTRII